MNTRINILGVALASALLIPSPASFAAERYAGSPVTGAPAKLPPHGPVPRGPAASTVEDGYWSNVDESFARLLRVDPPAMTPAYRERAEQDSLLQPVNVVLWQQSPAWYHVAPLAAVDPALR